MGAPLTASFLLSPHHPVPASLLCVSLCMCVHVPLPLIFPSPPPHCPPAPPALAPPAQQSLKADSRPLEGSPTQLPILADMLLYYCRFAARPVLLQVYQTEVSARRPATCPLGLTGRPPSHRRAQPEPRPHPMAAPGPELEEPGGSLQEVHPDAWSCPLQLTFITGEKSTEIFIHSLELGHSAATRAIKASGERCLSAGETGVCV